MKQILLIKTTLGVEYSFPREMPYNPERLRQLMPPDRVPDGNLILHNADESVLMVPWKRISRISCQADDETLWLRPPNTGGWGQ